MRVRKFLCHWHAMSYEITFRDAEELRVADEKIKSILEYLGIHSAHQVIIFSHKIEQSLLAALQISDPVRLHQHMSALARSNPARRVRAPAARVRVVNGMQS